MKSILLHISFTLIFISHLYSQNTGDIELKLSVNPVLTNQIDSLNYIIGLSNANGIKKEYQINDTSTYAIKLFFNALDDSYSNIKSDIYKIGEGIGEEVSSQKTKGLMNDSTLKYNEVSFKAGFIDGLNENYTIMNPNSANEYIQRTMNSRLKGDISLVSKLNYTCGLVNGYETKYWKLIPSARKEGPYTKILSTKEGIDDFMMGFNCGLKNNYNNKYGKLIKLGKDIGDNLRRQTKSGLMGDISLKLNISLIRQGLMNGLSDKKLSISPEEANTYIETTMKHIKTVRLEKEFGAYKIQNEDFLIKNKTEYGVITTKSGLQYEIINKGDGNYPNDSSKVRINYIGKLIDGTIFDNTYENGSSVVFIANKVVVGLTEAIKLMSVGSKYKFYIPQELAYGDTEQGKIKPFSVLIFEIELISIEN